MNKWNRDDNIWPPAFVDIVGISIYVYSVVVLSKILGNCSLITITFLCVCAFCFVCFLQPSWQGHIECLQWLIGWEQTITLPTKRGRNPVMWLCISIYFASVFVFKIVHLFCYTQNSISEDFWNYRTQSNADGMIIFALNRCLTTYQLFSLKQ